MFKLSIHNFHSIINKQKKIFFILLIGLSAILFSILFLFARFYMIYKQVCDDYMETKTMYIYFSKFPSDETQIHQICNITETSCFTNTSEIFFFDLNNNVIGCTSKNEDVIAIQYGRYFTKAEQNGKNVVLLSEGYLNHCDATFISNMLNEHIIIGDEIYTVIGRYNFTIDGNISTSKEVVIPLKTFIQNKYSIHQIKVVFNTKPKKEQIKAIKEYLDQSGVAYSVQFPSLIEKNAIIHAFEETGWNLLILFICFLSMFPLIQFWNQCNYKRLYVYYLYGCSEKNTKILLCLNTSYLYITALIIAFFIYICIENYFILHLFIAKLNFIQTISIYTIFYIVILFFVLNKNNLISQNETEYLKIK